MARIRGFEIYSIDLPFRKPFKHAAAERTTSYSIMVKCILESGTFGFGECLPREYVTGEKREHSFALLESQILPKLIGMEFNSLEHVISFLNDCDGKAPQDWVPSSTPQSAAWAAVDLALLDAFGREFNTPIRLDKNSQLPHSFRYSVVLSADYGLKAVKSLVKMRLYGFRQAKLKVEQKDSEKAVHLARIILGNKCDIRVDANMAWDVPEALKAMKSFSRHGVYSFEQPLAADNITGLAQLVKETSLGVMADESITDRESLENLIAHKACNAVNIRISKCGGLAAAFNRCKRALEQGLTLQIGCQVGETSLLSAAHLILVSAVKNVPYGEGCFGLHLLREDPAEPVLQFGYGGRPPSLPKGPGLGISIKENVLNRWCVKKQTIGES